MSDSLTERAKSLIEQSRREERLSAPRRRTRARRKTYAKIDDLATHTEPNLVLQQLADYWQVEVQTLRKWIRAGALTCFHIGRSPRVKRDVAVAFEKKNPLKKAV